MSHPFAIIHAALTARTTSPEREALRQAIEADQRPMPGTSKLLSPALSCEVLPSSWHRGIDVMVHDLVALAPIHLLGGQSVTRSSRFFHPVTAALEEEENV